MPFVMLIVEPRGQRAARNADEAQQAYDEMVAYGADLQSRGLLRAAESLRPDQHGVRVATADGRTQLRDGPFAEAKEMIGGFFLIDAADMDEAVAIAARCPAARWATVEVRECAPCNALTGWMDTGSSFPPQIVTADQATAVRRRLEAVWRLDAARIIARIGRIVRDVGMAEEFAHDALVAALEQWPRDGEPEQPVAWLTTTARRRALDYLRHRQMAGGKAAEIGFELDFQHLARSDDATGRVDDDLDDDIGDDLLRLMFTACHPILSPEARCALTLKVMGGLTTTEIARAYLRPEATIAQRIVRAKRALAAARVPFEVPRRAELGPRLASVLEVIYLIFNEAHAATAGEEWLRPGLCEQALRLGRVLCGLMPEQGEVFGLAALMELTASRFPARVTADGTPILLMDQDRGRWDPLLIRRGLAALASAETCGGPLGPYTLQAAIAACHARAHRAEDTDWMRISALYDALAGISPSPVISLNRAVAIAMAFGPQAGLDIVETLTGDPLLADYHLLPSVRGDLLARLGRIDEARREFERAATMTANARERTLLLARAQHPRSGED